MPESVNYWMPIPSPAGQLFHADPHMRLMLTLRPLTSAHPPPGVGRSVFRASHIGLRK